MAVRCPNRHGSSIVSARYGLPTGLHVKLLGWIKSAVEFVKLPAGPRKVGPQPDLPHESHEAHETHETHEIERRALPQDISRDDSPDVIESPPESQASVAPESRIGIEPESRTAESEGSPSQDEIDRRRSVVRGFFNDYWSSIDDKPASFAERLDRAEGYINERVAAGGENWRLEPATRKQLGLPPSRKK
jgi:hypothetical protein